jgi:hypothetical protein
MKTDKARGIDTQEKLTYCPLCKGFFTKYHSCFNPQPFEEQMKTDKPREFWLEDNGIEFFVHKFNPKGFKPVTHVIEYTAVEQLEQKVKEVEAEYEVASRFGEWLEVDMSGCYDAAEMVNLWKVKVNELNEKLTASEARVNTLESSLDKWIATADENDRQRKIAEEKIAAQELELQLLEKIEVYCENGSAVIKYDNGLTVITSGQTWKLDKLESTLTKV